MKQFLLTIGLCLCTLGAAVGQSTIAFQSFESGSDNWTYTANPAAGSFTSGDDEWNILNSLGTLSNMPSDGSSFFGGVDIENNDNGNGTFGELVFNSVSVSGFTSVSISFDYEVDGFDGGDDIFYTVSINGVAQTEVNLVDGASNLDANGTETINIPDGSDNVTITVKIDQNGTDYVGIDNFKVTGTSAGGTPTKLAITDVHSSEDPVEGETFSVTVQSQDGDDLPANVSQDTTVTLSATGGTGTLSGTLTGTITNGNNSVTFSGLSYDVAETFTLNATNTGGSLTADTESVTILSDADKLVIKDFPTTGNKNISLNSFTVEAQRSSDNSVDETYTENITIAKVSGSGAIGGTVTKAAVNGVATFDNITFDADDTYTINAGDGTLTSATSSSLVIDSPDFIESFENEASEIGASYSDGSFTGVTGVVWTYVESRDEDSFPINGDNAIMLRESSSNSSLTSNTISGGIQNFSVKLKKAFTGSGNRQVELFIGPNTSSLTSLGTSVAFDDTDVRTFNVENINYAGDFVIRISNITSKQVNIDDISWNSYDDGERQITGDAGWRMLSFPISGGSVEDISDDTAIQGVTGGDNIDKPSNFQTYDNTGAFETPASVSTNLVNGYGFITYFYDNTDAGSSELPITLDVSGTEPSSNVSVNLNVSTLDNGSYYTMVGNPYASNFNLNSITETGGSIQNNVHFWDNSAGANGSYSALDRTTPYIVEPWQGFWVETTSSDVTAISMPTSGKTSTAATGTFFAKENPNRGDIDFTLSSASTFDKAIRLSARPDAVIGYDLSDASKFTPLVNSFATMAFVGSIDNEDKLQSVFSVPSQLEEEVTIPLRISTSGVSGEFTFAWENLATMSDEWDITLTDHDNGTNVSLREVNSYTFTVDEVKEKSTRTILDVATTLENEEGAKNRFSLTIVPSTAVSNEPISQPSKFELGQNYPNPFNPTTTITYSVGQSGPVNITVYNVMGRKVAELVNATKNAGTDYKVSWNATGQASGIYYYRLTAPGQVLTRQMTLIK